MSLRMRGSAQPRRTPRQFCDSHSGVVKDQTSEAIAHRGISRFRACIFDAPRNDRGKSEALISTLAFVLLFLGALAGGFVSGLAGFGTALMTLGIWLYVLPPAVAVPLVLTCSIVAQSSTLPALCASI